MPSGKRNNADERARAARRTAIVRRLAEMDAPSRLDLERAAVELGVSQRRVNSLLKAWRQHGRTRLILGSIERNPKTLGSAALAASGELDLSGIRVPHRPEVERRVRLIGRYLAEGLNDEVTTSRYAEEYGRKTHHFRRAVTAWIISRDPAALPGISYMVEGGRFRELPAAASVRATTSCATPRLAGTRSAGSGR